MAIVIKQFYPKEGAWEGTEKVLSSCSNNLPHLPCYKHFPPTPCFGPKSYDIGKAWYSFLFIVPWSAFTNVQGSSAWALAKKLFWFTYGTLKNSYCIVVTHINLSLASWMGFSLTCRTNFVLQESVPHLYHRCAKWNFALPIGRKLWYSLHAACSIGPCQCPSHVPIHQLYSWLCEESKNSSSAGQNANIFTF
jgi:hypothetical protein